MQKFIVKQSNTFRNLVCEHYQKVFGLKLHLQRNWSNFHNTQLHHDTLYASPFLDRLVVSNTVINKQYSLSLDNAKYSDLVVLYRNIQLHKNNNQIRKAEIFHKDIQRTFLIGRKYSADGTVINDVFGVPVEIDIVHPLVPKRKEKADTHVFDRSKLRAYKRIFKHHFSHDLTSLRNITQHIFSIDTEYLNDIYDSWSTFPISEDHSNLFMIGICDFNKNYSNYTVKRLNRTSEEEMLSHFFTDMINKFKQSSTKPIFLHWSKAEITAFNKAIQRNPKISQLYKSFCESVVFLDLLPIVKKTVLLDSYSLKYVGSTLLNINYDTICQTGADAVVSIIDAENDLKGTLKELTHDSRVGDLIRYNQLDTHMLIDVLNFFI